MSDFKVSVEQISEIVPIPEKDRIVLATVKGWRCIVKKDEFKVGDYGLFFPPDSLLPANDDRFDFMLSKAFRVKTIKLGAAYSQGLLLPLKLFPEVTEPFYDNYAEKLNVVKYIRPAESNLTLAGDQKGPFPAGYRKTDQERIQNLANIIPDLNSVGSYEITEKLDGTSITVIIEPGSDIRVCSRNFELKETEGNIYWNVARQWFPVEGNKIKEILHKLYPKGCAIQAEIIGPGVQGNAYKLEKPTGFVFDIWDAGNQWYCPSVAKRMLWAESDEVIKYVPTYSYCSNPNGCQTLDDFLNLSIKLCKKSSVYPGTKAEGLVFKSLEKTQKDFGNKSAMWSRGDIVSFKVINNEWLLENE
jgi:RNA ligase (TIGR02306 family)